MPIVLATFACSNKRAKSSDEGLTLYMSALEILKSVDKTKLFSKFNLAI